MKKSFGDFIKSVTNRMSGEIDVSTLSLTEFKESLFDYGIVIKLDESQTGDFISILQDVNEIGPVTAAFIEQVFETEYCGYTPLYFGKSLYENDCVYLIGYPCDINGNQSQLDSTETKKLATYVLNMGKPYLNDTVEVVYEWVGNGYSATAIRI